MDASRDKVKSLKYSKRKEKPFLLSKLKPAQTCHLLKQMSIQGDDSTSKNHSSRFLSASDRELALSYVGSGTFAEPDRQIESLGRV